MVLLHVGMNDLCIRNNHEICHKIFILTHLLKVRNPSVTVLVSSVLPRPVDEEDSRLRLINLNLALFRSRDDSIHVQYKFIKSYNRFLSHGFADRSMYRRDLLHLNSKGVRELYHCFMLALMYA